MTYKKINHFAPRENTYFDVFIGISGWFFGFFEGVIFGLMNMCGKKESDDGELLHEIEVFTYEMSSGYSTGKKDVNIVGKQS
jgi:hypothetical protein